MSMIEIAGMIQERDQEIASLRARLAEVEGERDRLRARVDYCPRCDCKSCRDVRSEWHDRMALDTVGLEAQDE